MNENHSLKEISIIEIEKIIAEALEKVTDKKYQIEIHNLDFSLDVPYVFSKMNITIRESITRSKSIEGEFDIAKALVNSIKNKDEVEDDNIPF